MPRKGYEVITVTDEAREALSKLKVMLNAKSFSEAIVKAYALVDTFYRLLSPDYPRPDVTKTKATYIRISLPQHHTVPSS